MSGPLVPGWKTWLMAGILTVVHMKTRRRMPRRLRSRNWQIAQKQWERVASVTR